MLVHLPLLGAGLVLDDVPIIGQNPVLERGSVGELLTTGWWSAVGNAEATLHRPVTMISFLPDRDGAGAVRLPRAHGVNLLLHAATSVALVVLLLRLGAGRGAAGMAGLLFAVHPVHVPAVGPLVGRADLLAALWTLLAVLAYTRAGAEATPARARLASWAAGACVFLAAGSKEIGIAAPLLLVAYDLLHRRPERGRLGAWLVDRSAALAPSALGVFVFLLLRTAAIEAFPGFTRISHYANPIAAVEGAPRLWSALGVAARYAAALVWPVAPAAEHSGAMVPVEPTWLAPRPLVGALLLGALLLAVALGLRARASDAARRRAFAATLALGPYLVIGNLVFLIGTVMAERLLYLPSAGLAALAGLGVARLAARGGRARRVTLAALLVALALLGWRSWQESRIWRAEDTLWQAELRRHPDSATARLIEAGRLHRLGRLEEAEQQLDAVLALWPDTAAALYEKGVIAAQRGDLASAEAWLRPSVRLDPWNAGARADLGIVIHRQGRPAEAERHLRWALADFPGLEKASSELAELLFEAGRFAEAVPHYRAALAQGRRDLGARAAEAERRAMAASGP